MTHDCIRKLIQCSTMAIMFAGIAEMPAAGVDIQPYARNPHYWQYGGRPVLLLGGSETDHIFLIDNLERHLDEIVRAGGNYVRCTMSQREGLDLKPHRRSADGEFDLDEWNTDYWNRFANCLKWCNERDIVIQIEVWDRFDYSRDNWKHSPWHPGNNVNYTNEQTGFADEYPLHPGQDKQPFFHTVPGVEQYRKKYDLIRGFQEKFVDQVLSYSLKYGNVLYCMDNETSSAEAWAVFWSEHIRKRAAEAGVEVHMTEMWDQRDPTGDHHRRTYDHPERYSFVDISQNNHNRGQDHWDRLQAVRSYLAKRPRPINTVKIYGSDEPYKNAPPGAREGVRGLYGRTQEGLERFWRNIFGGVAATRFHRQPPGIGFVDPFRQNVSSAREVTDALDIFRCEPRHDLLGEREANEAYCLAEPGRQYAVYFPSTGDVTLDTTAADEETVSIRWYDIDQGRWKPTDESRVGNSMRLKTPGDGQWAVVIQARSATR